MVNSWQQKTESSQPKGISEQEWGTGWLHCLLFCKNLPGAEPQKIYESSRQTWFTKETMPGLNSQHWRAENGTFARLQGSWRRCCWDLWLPAGPIWGWRGPSRTWPFSESTTYEQWLQRDDVCEWCHKQGSSMLSSTAPDLLMRA